MPKGFSHECTSRKPRERKASSKDKSQGGIGAANVYLVSRPDAVKIVHKSWCVAGAAQYRSSMYIGLRLTSTVLIYCIVNSVQEHQISVSFLSRYEKGVH